MKRLRLLIAALCLILPGCTVAPFVIGPTIDAYLMWKNGEARAYYACDGFRAHEAMKIALTDLNYIIEKDEPQKTDGNYYILARNSSAKDSFKINIEQVESLTCLIRIRVDFMGDKEYAQLIYRRLNKQLDVIVFDPKNRDSKHFWQRF